MISRAEGDCEAAGGGENGTREAAGAEARVGVEDELQAMAGDGLRTREGALRAR